MNWVAGGGSSAAPAPIPVGQRPFAPATVLPRNREAWQAAMAHAQAHEHATYREVAQGMLEHLAVFQRERQG